jgi:hypothetical protein
VSSPFPDRAIASPIHDGRGMDAAWTRHRRGADLTCVTTNLHFLVNGDTVWSVVQTIMGHKQRELQAEKEPEEMESTLDLQLLEKRAYRSTQQTGVLEVYIGVLLIAVAGFMTLLDYEVGYGWALGIYTAVVVGVAVAHKWLNRYVRARYVGTAQFGATRKRKVRKVHLVMLGSFLAGVTLFFATLYFMKNPGMPFNIPMVISAAWSLNVLIVFGALGYFLDNPRFFMYGMILAVTVPLDLGLREFAHVKASWLAYGIPGLFLVITGARMMRDLLRRNPAYDMGQSDD